MLNSFCVGLGRLGGNAHRAKEIDNQSVASPHSFGESLAFLCQEYPAIWTSGRQSRPL